MEHPEPPVLVSESVDELVSGDVITLEPGCYIEGQGGMRFEHNYVIRESGFERLSNHHIGLSNSVADGSNWFGAVRDDSVRS